MTTMVALFASFRNVLVIYKSYTVCLLSVLMTLVEWDLLRGVSCCVLVCSLFSLFLVLFSIVITALGKERADLSASRACVC